MSRLVVHYYITQMPDVLPRIIHALNEAGCPLGFRGFFFFFSNIVFFYLHFLLLFLTFPFINLTTIATGLEIVPIIILFFGYPPRKVFAFIVAKFI